MDWPNGLMWGKDNAWEGREQPDPVSITLSPIVHLKHHPAGYIQQILKAHCISHLPMEVKSCLGFDGNHSGGWTGEEHTGVDTVLLVKVFHLVDIYCKPIIDQNFVCLNARSIIISFLWLRVGHYWSLGSINIQFVFEAIINADFIIIAIIAKVT